jgi:hypothetical protein
LSQIQSQMGHDGAGPTDRVASSVDEAQRKALDHLSGCADWLKIRSDQYGSERPVASELRPTHWPFCSKNRGGWVPWPALCASPVPSSALERLAGARTVGVLHAMIVHYPNTPTASRDDLHGQSTCHWPDGCIGRVASTYAD